MSNTKEMIDGDVAKEQMTDVDIHGHLDTRDAVRESLVWIAVITMGTCEILYAYMYELAQAKRGLMVILKKWEVTFQ